jgi:hypothetical protein
MRKRETPPPSFLTDGGYDSNNHYLDTTSNIDHNIVTTAVPSTAAGAANIESIAQTMSSSNINLPILPTTMSSSRSRESSISGTATTSAVADLAVADSSDINTLLQQQQQIVGVNGPGSNIRRSSSGSTGTLSELKTNSRKSSTKYLHTGTSISPLLTQGSVHKSNVDNLEMLNSHHDDGPGGTGGSTV